MVSPSGVGVTYTDFNVLVGQSYTYSVQAGDGDGNNGPQSDTVLIIINEGAVSQITSPPSHIEDQVTVPIDIPKTTVYSNVNYNEQATALTPPDTVGLSSFGKELHITWKNPKNSQFRTTRVIKKIGSYPTKITEGTIICDGIKEECVDKDVEQKTTYYYGVYAVDQSFITSQVVTVSGSLVNEMKVNPASSVTSKITHSTPEALPWGTREVASTPTSGITNTFFFTKTLKLGSTDDDVLFLQKYLNTHGFVISITGGGSKGFETKLFGPATEKALKVYQCSKKIVCEGTPISTGYGMVGKTTRMYLNKKE